MPNYQLLKANGADILKKLFVLIILEKQKQRNLICICVIQVVRQCAKDLMDTGRLMVLRACYCYCYCYCSSAFALVNEFLDQIQKYLKYLQGHVLIKALYMNDEYSWLQFSNFSIVKNVSQYKKLKITNVKYLYLFSAQASSAFLTCHTQVQTTHPTFY